MIEKEQIISLLYELATPQKMGSFFVNNATPDFLFIRPSGNPISAKGFEEMMNSGDVVPVSYTHLTLPTTPYV